MDTTVVLITLVFYKLVLIGIGLWAERRTKSEEDFFLGGRQLGPVVGAISYSASAASAFALLGMSGAAYVLGLSAIWVAAGAVLGSVVAWIWVAPRMMAYSREHNLLTLTEFMAHGASGGIRKAITIFASLVIFLSFIFYIASQFQGAGNTFALTFDMAAGDSIMLGGGVILIYTILGGFWAVSVTDTLQGILMLITAIILPIAAYFAVVDMAGGLWSGLISVYDQEALTISGKNIGLAVIGMIAGNLAIGLGALGQPHLHARFMAIKDEKSMRLARVIGISWYTTVFFGMFALGLMGHVLVPAIENPENVFFTLTTELFPPVIGGILLAAVLSAIMSTADSMLLVAAATVSHDLGVGRMFKGKEVLISRLSITVICILSIWVAINLPASIFSRVLFAWNALGAAFAPLILMRLAGIKVKHMGALLAMIVGFSLTVIFFLEPNTPGDVQERVAPFVAGLLILILAREKKQQQ